MSNDKERIEKAAEETCYKRVRVDHVGNPCILMAELRRIIIQERTAEHDFLSGQLKEKEERIAELEKDFKQACDVLEPQIKGAQAWEEECGKLESQLSERDQEIARLKFELHKCLIGM